MTDLGHVAGVVTIPTGVQVRLVWTLPNTKTVYNVLHGIVAGGFVSSSTVAEAMFAAVKASAGWTTWKAKVNSGVNLAAIDLRDIRTAYQPTHASTGLASAGTGAGTALPPGDALVVTLRTATVGRGSRGRVYLPGLDSTALAAGGVADPTTVTAAEGFINAVSAAMTASAITLALANPERNQYVSPITGANHLHRDAVMKAITEVKCRNAIIDHQRKRAGRS